MTLLSSLRSLTLRLWDEQTSTLVGYGRMRERRRALRGPATAARRPLPDR